MTDTEIRIAIAEACGWTLEKTNVHDGKCWHLNGIQSEISPPDYHNDLNAMHEAEKFFIYTNGCSEQYGCVLSQVVLQGAQISEQAARFKILHATARQRAEAFLRTIDKWK